jgi:hypothetical protein
LVSCLRFLGGMVQNLHMSLYLVAELDELILDEVVYIPKILVYKGVPLRANYKAIVECKKRAIFTVYTHVYVYMHTYFMCVYICVCNTSLPRKRCQKYKIEVSPSTFIATILTKYGKLFLNFFCTFF